jgi:hypothetical protein
LDAWGLDLLWKRREVTRMARKKQDSKFIDSVPEVIERAQDFKSRTLDNPDIPFPWPPYVPKPETIDVCIAHLQNIYEAGEDKELRTGGELGRARKTLKTRFCLLARHVALTLEGRNYTVNWPGFDLARTPEESRTGLPYRQLPFVVKGEDD